MKREGLFLLVLIILVGILVNIRPQLKDSRRLHTDFPPWSYHQKVDTSAAIVSTAIFHNRAVATWNLPGPTTFFRNSFQRDGVSTFSVPIQLKIDWRFNDLNIGMHGASKASPAVDSTGVYVGGDSGWFYAINLDGTLRWKFHISDSLRGIHSTAILHGGKVCIGGYNGTFYCLDKRNGQVLWSLQTPNGGFGASPLVLGDYLLAVVETGSLNAYFMKVDLRDGRVLWQSPWLGEQSHSSPAFDPRTDSLYAGANNSMFFRVRQKDGQIMWKMDLGGPIKDTPLVGEKCVYVTSWGQHLFCIDRVSGKLIWEVALSGRSQSSPTLIPGTQILIVGDSRGMLYGVDSETGKIKWQRQTDLSLMTSALAAREPGTKRWLAWMACAQNRLCVIDPLTGKSINQISIPGNLTGVPVAYDNAIYVALNFPGGLVKLTY